jgi:hypothetical protein
MRQFFLPDKLLHILINATPKTRFLLLSGLGAGVLVLPAGVFASLHLMSSPQVVFEKQSSQTGMSVLAAETKNPDFVFNVNVPSFFSDDVTVEGGLVVQGKAVFSNGVDLSGNDVNLGKGKLTASNLLYSITAGDGLSITDGQNPTITNTGVTSLQGKNGKLSLEAGNGITIDGLKISATGSTSDQNVFTTISVFGQSDIITSSTTDTLTFAAGSGINLTTDPTTKKLTIAATGGGGGGAGVDSVDGLDGGLTIANSTGSGSTITIDNASTSQKGIAQFSSTNFSVTNGLVNLIQSIATSASPSFVGMTLSAFSTNGGLLYTDASGLLSQLGVGTSGQLLTSNGTGSAPSWQDPSWHVSAPDAYRGGNVGIGTPSYPTTPGLTVYQYSQSNWMIRTRTGTVDNSSGIWQDSSKNMQFQARDGSGNLQIVLDSASSGLSYINAGNFGIGTSTPDYKLVVNSSGDALEKWSKGGTTILALDNSSGEALFTNATAARFGFGDTGTPIRMVSEAGVGYIQVPDLTLSTLFGAQGTLFTSNFATSYFTGNVGLGSTTPNEKLDVNGRIYMSDSSAPGTTANRLYAVSGSIYWNGAQLATVGGAGSSQWTTSGSTIYYTTGNVGIGSTSPIGLLNVSGNPIGKALTILNATGGQDIFTASASGTTKFTINNAGQLYLADGTAPSSTTNRLYAVSGGLYWNGAQISTASGPQWITSATDIYYNTGGNVGIGGTGTSSRLEVKSYNTNTDVQRWMAFDGSRLARVTETSGGAGWFEVDNASGVAQMLIRGDGTGSYFLGNIGIGTSLPVGLLNLDGGAVGKALAIFNQTGNQDIFTASTSGSTKFVINNSGNVGIGTSNPHQALETNGIIRSTDGTFVADFLVTGIGPRITFGDTGNNANLFTFGAYNSVNNIDTKGRNLRIYSTNDTTGLTYLQSGGNFGIGTTTPGEKLDVNGRVHLADVSAPGDTTNKLYANGGDLYWNGVAITNGGGLDGSSQWGTSGSNIFYTDGNVGVGTTNAGAKMQLRTTTQATLDDVKGNVGVAGLALTSTYGSDGGVLPGLVWSTSDNNATKPKAGIWTSVDNSGAYMSFGTSGTYTNGVTNTAMTINPAGGIGIGTGNAQGSLLHLYYATSRDLLRLGNNLTNIGDTSNIAFGNSTDVDWAKIGSIVEDSGKMGLSFYTTENAGTDTPERVRISASGNVGIGTTDPQSPLSVLTGSAGDTTTPDGNWAAQILNDNDVDGAGGLVVANRWYNQSTSVFSAGTLCDSCGTAGFDTFFTVRGGGNVGIGTTDPSEKLDLSGAMHIADVTAPGDTTNKLYAVGGSLFWNGTDLTAGAGASVWGLNGSKLYYNDGYVGIGTNDPENPLQITGDFSNSNGIGARIVGTNLGGSFFNAVQEGINSWGIGMLPGNNKLSFISNYSNPNAYDGERMTLDGAGNLGLGTTDPSTLLDLHRNDTDLLKLTFDNSQFENGPAILLSDQNYNLARIQALTDTDTVQGALSFQTGDNGVLTDRMRIISNGNVGIGTKSPQSRVHIDMSGGTIPPLYGGTDFILSDTQSDFSNTIATILSGDAAEAILYLGDSQAENSGAIRYDNATDSLKLDTNGWTKMIIDDVGNVGIGTTSTSYPLTIGTNGTNGNGAYLSEGGDWTNGSSRDFKENFTSLDQQTILDKINSLSIQQWNYKGDSNAKHIGPFAEDFYNTFNVGNDNKHISTIDPAGVALVGIQALSKQLDDMKAQMGIASVSANFAPTALALGLSQETATISGTLTVLGRTTLTDVGVTGKIVTGLMGIDGAAGSINVTGDLKLQPNGIGNIDLFAGKITVDNKGNIHTDGTITAKKINIDTTDVAGASAGVGNVTKGAESVTIDTSAVTDHSLIQVTFSDDYAPASRYWISAKSTGTSFTVKLDKSVDNDSHFNWWIVN